MSARLKTVYLVLHQGFADTLLRQLFGTFSEIPLPNLCVLPLDCDIEVGRKCTTLCHDWDMPSLRILKVVNVLLQLAPAAGPAYIDIYAIPARCVIGVSCLLTFQKFKKTNPNLYQLDYM